MDRVQSFQREGKQIVYYDLSSIKTNEELSQVVQIAKENMGAYEHASVYTITNISQISFDTKTKEIAAEWMAFNKPFVINAAFIGVTGVRKMMMSAVFSLSGRTNIKLFHDMEEAFAWIDTLNA